MEENSTVLVTSANGNVGRRLNNPVAFEPYPSAKKRYRIYVRNYVVYYVVIDDVMEVRGLMYGARDSDRHL